MSQSVNIKVVFKEDRGDRDHILHLIFNNDYDLVPQIDNWLAANLKGIESWEFAKEQE